jgi:hypothetical protein
MPENPQNKKRGWLATMIWKTYPEIEQSAARYSTTSLVKSDRAYFIYFFIATAILSMTVAAFAGGKSPIDMEGVLWEAAIIGFLSIFILMGHVWAMGLALIMYTADKILLMLPPTSARPLPQIIFGLICWQLGSTAIRVEIERKRRTKTQTRAEPPPLA